MQRGLKFADILYQCPLTFFIIIFLNNYTGPTREVFTNGVPGKALN